MTAEDSIQVLTDRQNAAHTAGMPTESPPRYPEYQGSEPCTKSKDPDLEWFGWHDGTDEKKGSIDVETAEAARNKCDTCPMLEPCMKWAVSFNERSGIWGGTTPEERKVIKKLPEWPEWDSGKRLWCMRTTNSVGYFKDAS